VIRDHKGSIERIAGSHTDVTDRRLQEIEINKLSYHDILTGLPNRAYLNKEINSVLHHYNKESLCGGTIFIGLDNFSVINEFFGHETGDKALIHISNKLKDVFNQCANVFISKFSGDKFVIIVKNISNEAIFLG
jgi:diguanylate cyclase (GGDEF)-like protein